MKKYIYLYICLLMLLASCATYDENITTYDVTLQLINNSSPLRGKATGRRAMLGNGWEGSGGWEGASGSGIVVQLRDSRNTVFTAESDTTNTVHFTLPAGIYQASASKVTEGDYVRTIYNGNINDLVIEGNTTQTMSVTTSVVTLRNPILIKEIYCGGCQKDDGSGTFAMDKCIILYNNSSAVVSLDSIAIGMVEPYNAEASTHSFLTNGKLDYQDESWIPAINGIWYFQDGQTIQPYSELVVNVCGAIDNTPTYSNSVNYANSNYYCMYDPSYTSSDGKSYNNTKYYPTPASVIPSSHYLLTVKYGQANAWPLSQLSPALLLFKPQGTTPKQYAEQLDNIIYPTGKSGNMVYACLKVERSWVLDAVEVYNANKLSDSKKRLTSDLDNGYVTLFGGYGHALVRKVAKTIVGHAIYEDTNNSTNDFYEAEHVSIAQ